MTDQYSSNGIGVLKIEEKNSQDGSNLGYEAKFYDQIGIPGSAHIVNALDIIDLNAFAKEPDNNSLPRALMVWCKEEYLKGWDNRQLTAPTCLKVCRLEFKGNSCKLDIDQVIDLTFNTEHKYKKKKYTFKFGNVVHGFLTAPDANGRLSYWYGYSGDGELKQEKNTWKLKCAKAPICRNIIFDKEQNRITLSEFSSYFYKCNYEASSTDDKTLSRQAYTRGPGIEIRVDPSSDAGIYSVDIDIAEGDYHKKEECDNAIIGKIKYMSPSDVFELNKTLSANLPEIPEETVQQMIEARLLKDGVKVYAVIYGWPYSAVEDVLNPPAYPSYEQTDAQSYLESKGSGCGDSLSNEVGVSAGYKGLCFKVNANAGFKSDFQTMYRESTDKSASLSLSSRISKGDIPSEEWRKTGIVLYNKIKPVIVSYGWIEPKYGDIKVDGLPGVPFVVVMMAVGEGADSGVMISKFDVTDPSKLIVPQWDDVVPGNTYSGLSDGLLSRPDAFLNKDNFDNNARAIQNWQTEKSNDLNYLINTLLPEYNATKVDMGVVPYLRDCSGTPYNLSMDTSIKGQTCISEGTSDESSTGYGAAWSFKSSVFGFGGYDQGSFMHTSSSVYKTDESSSKGFAISIPACTTLKSVSFKLYTLYIDVPALKGRLADSEGNVKKPSYVPNWNWKYNQSFMLIVPYVPQGYSMADAAL